MMKNAMSGTVALVTMAALVTLGCSAGPGATATPRATTVDVTLQEWAVLTSVSSAPAGQVRFVATNAGPDDAHELVIVRSDLSLTDLPTDATGKVDENGAGMEVIDEIEEFAVGTTQEKTVNLTPGAYVLICNIYTQSENEAHYQEGMRTTFTVN
jgi:hypothetical protein